MARRPREVQPARRSLWPQAGWALLSGLLLGCAFPPVDCKWLVWIGLVPLFWALREAPSRQAFLFGALAGFVFFLLTLYPLVSAHSWTGWAAETPAAFSSRMSRQWAFLHGVYLVFALWGALFWGGWAAAVRWLAARGGWRSLAIIPSLWMLLPEWARAQTTFGVTWAFLGNATAGFGPIRGLAALGGVLLLSGVVVLANVALLQAWMRRGVRGRWNPLAVIAGCAAVAVVLSRWSLSWRSLRSQPIDVAAIQHVKPEYTTKDFLAIGLDRNYLPLVQQALREPKRLVVLPESITLGAITLDGTASGAKPPEWQVERARWDAQMRQVLSGTSTILILGADTVEHGQDHNTLIAWTAEGSVGWYHKRRLVPFSEYVPSGWSRWAARGRSQYSPGQGAQLIRTHGLVIGGFICQEVLIPWVTRDSVRDGATLLVTGGNDGVFGDPAVARIHADAAQLRAAETGRYVVRAMKTGISAIIDPYGRELARSRSAEPALLTDQISPVNGITPYVRFGDWVVWLSAVGLLLTARPRIR